jgi:hypothetical protein
MHEAVLLPQFVAHGKAQRQIPRPHMREFGAEQHAERLGMQRAARAIQ